MAEPRIIATGDSDSSGHYAQHIYNWTTRYLARDPVSWDGSVGADRRHDYFGIKSPGESGRFSESWRYPLVEAYYDRAATPEENLKWNEVTFIYRAESEPVPEVRVVGLPFPPLRDFALRQVEDSLYLAATVLLPAARAYRYALLVDGNAICDPLNPEREFQNNGEELSVFYTQRCFELLILERWEVTLLKRMTNHILPFNSREVDVFQANPGSGEFAKLKPQLYRLDYAVGAVNYIDKILAREERHHLGTYKACLRQINNVLRGRNPYLEPGAQAEENYVQLYNEMASGQIPSGWNSSPETGYDNPKYFLSLLRRHVWTGAFSHPKYGGNVGGVAWLWLKDQFPFNYEAALEAPYGSNPDYRG